MNQINKFWKFYSLIALNEMLYFLQENKRDRFIQSATLFLIHQIAVRETRSLFSLVKRPGKAGEKRIRLGSRALGLRPSRERSR